MGVNHLGTSQLRYNPMWSVSDFDGMAADGGLCSQTPETFHAGSTANSDPFAEQRLAERTRIAQELHDTLLQGFLAVSMQLHVAVDRLPADCAEKQRFSDVLQLVNRVLEEGRCALQGLRSPNNHSTSLGEAFSRIPSDLGLPSAAGFRVVVLGTEKELRAELHDEVFRIGCEAILNACRHSRAREIETEVEYCPAGLRIAVRDNGCGIGPQELDKGRNGHWGLQGMRERADRIGARLRFWSKVALGTEVELCVPSWVAFEQMQGRAAH
jgi:signal transduction histidine kinase